MPIASHTESPPNPDQDREVSNGRTVLVGIAVAVYVGADAVVPADGLIYSGVHCGWLRQYLCGRTGYEDISGYQAEDD